MMRSNSSAPPKSTMLCGSWKSDSNIVQIHLGKTIAVKNSSLPMLEVTLEFDSEFDHIKKTDVLYLLSEKEKDMPRALPELNPRRK